MKSLSVRIAAGAVVILFGAYAAALAQKDKQNNSESWSVEAPTLGDLPEPIADPDQTVASGTNSIDGIDPLAAALTQSRRSAETAAGSDATGSDSIQLVQHTEIVGSSEPVDDAAAPSVAPPAWTLPPAGAPLEADSTATAPADNQPAMTFPGSADPNQLSATTPDSSSVTANAVAEGSVTATTVDMPEFQFNEVPEMEIEVAGDGAASETAGGIDATAQPGFQFNASVSEVTPVADAQPTSNGGASTANLGMPAPVGGQSDSRSPLMDASAADFSTSTPQVASADDPSTGQPANMLRGSSAGTNVLRGNEPTIAATGNGAPAEFASPSPYGAADMAQQSPRLGGAMQQFDESRNGGPAPIGSVPAGVQPVDPNQRAASLGNIPTGIALENSGSTSAILSSGGPTPMVAPQQAIAMDPNDTVDAPGDRRLEGVQTPSVIIQKRAPSEVKVGKPAAFAIQVQNVGAVDALDVRVQDRIPAGMRLVDATPTPAVQGNLMVWDLGTMPAGDERTLTIQLIPEQEGELGSVARVSFEAAASVRTISTRPQLSVTQRAPETVLIGQQLEIELQVANPGTGDATNVVLQEDVPDGLEHPQGRKLDNALGTLAPGEVRNQVLRLRAVKPGIVENTIRLIGDDGLQTEDTVRVQVVSPELQVALEGPSRRFLERPATYQVKLQNVGTADATNIEMAVKLDRGFTFVSADQEGQYDPSRHMVLWSLARLPAGSGGAATLTLLPIEEGEQAMLVDARADLGVFTKSERTMSVEGFAELSFALTNPGGPIEVGTQTRYEIVVTNNGSKPDSNVRVQLQLPRGLELVSSDTEAGSDGNGLVVFAPKKQLAPGEEARYGIVVAGQAPGTHLVKAIVVSDQSEVPVTKEESTLVYSDQ